MTANTFKPVRIALDLSAGKMYWTDAELGELMISRANLDGTGFAVVESHAVIPSGIALVMEAGAIPMVSGWGQVGMILALIQFGRIALKRRRSGAINSST